MSKNVLALIDGDVRGMLTELLAGLEDRCVVLRQVLDGFGKPADGKKTSGRLRLVSKVRGDSLNLPPRPADWNDMRLSEQVRWVLKRAPRPLDATEIAKVIGVPNKKIWNALSWERSQGHLIITKRSGDGRKVYKAKAHI